MEECNVFSSIETGIQQRTAHFLVVTLASNPKISHTFVALRTSHLPNLVFVASVFFEFGSGYVTCSERLHRTCVMNL